MFPSKGRPGGGGGEDGGGGLLAEYPQ